MTHAAQLELSDLEIDWLWQIVVTMITQVAASHCCSLPEAVAFVGADYPSHVRRVIRVIFQNQPLDVDQQAVGSPEVDEVSAIPTTAREQETEEIEDQGFLAAKLLDR